MGRALDFKWCSLEQWQHEHLSEWYALAQDALTPNFYLSPEFVVSAANHLVESPVQAASLWHADTLVALGFFVVRPGSLRFPFKRLLALQCRHTFETGMLLRNGCDSQRVFDQFVQHLLQFSAGVEFRDLKSGTRLFELVQNKQRERGVWVEEGDYLRASLTDPAAAIAQLSARRRKRIRRQLRQLEALGTVNFEVCSGEKIPSCMIDEFMRIEALGWKKQSALQSTESGQLFFRGLMACAKRNNSVFVSVLSLDTRIVSMAINFVSGHDAFAFKVAYDPAYQDYSPGILNEYLALLHFAENGFPYRSFDSGAQADSYIDAYWPDRTRMVAGTLLNSGVALRLFQLKTWIKSRFQRQAVPAQALD